jgi:hypothetical protein
VAVLQRAYLAAVTIPSFRDDLAKLPGADPKDDKFLGLAESCQSALGRIAL